MITRWQWSVPANLLIAGEYAVVEDGGYGVSAAVEPRATATVYTSAREHDTHDRFLSILAACISGDGSIDLNTLGTHMQVETNEGSDHHLVSPGQGHPIVDAVAAVLTAYLASSGNRPATRETPVAPWRIQIDTEAFFDTENGEKMGLGSSAAATVLLSSAFFQLAGIDPVQHRDNVILRAVEAHRMAHGGRGSGYDVATSALGGLIRFVGGRVPQWERSPIHSLWLRSDLRLYGLRCGRPVRSSCAVQRFHHYLPAGSEEHRRFLQDNNRIIEEMEASRTWTDLSRTIAAARGLGEEVGSSIGVPAHIDIGKAHCDDGWVAKASGAGNERACIIATPSPRRAVPRSSHRMYVADDGLRWEYRRGQRAETLHRAPSGADAHPERPRVSLSYRTVAEHARIVRGGPYPSVDIDRRRAVEP